MQWRDQLDSGFAIIPLLGPRSRDQAWCDGVYAHAAARVLSHDRGQVTKSGLGHGIRQGTAYLPDPGQRGDVDDPAVVGAAQERQSRLADQVHADSLQLAGGPLSHEPSLQRSQAWQDRGSMTVRVDRM